MQKKIKKHDITIHFYPKTRMRDIVDFSIKGIKQVSDSDLNINHIINLEVYDCFLEITIQDQDRAEILYILYIPLCTMRSIYLKEYCSNVQ